MLNGPINLYILDKGGEEGEWGFFLEIRKKSLKSLHLHIYLQKFHFLPPQLI